MKMLTALLVAVALISHAFAQKMTVPPPQKIKLHPMAPAAKPLLLHTAKPLTQNDKNQLLASAIKAYAAKLPAGAMMPQMNLAPKNAITLTPSHFSQDNVHLVLYNPAYVDIANDMFQFSNSPTSSLMLVVNAQPNTAYYFAFKVSPVTGGNTYTIYTGDYLAPQFSENFTGSQGNDEFAFAVVSNSSGTLLVSIYSADTEWNFINCEVTSVTF